jgi:HEPN superfamily Apea-like protein
MTKHKPKHFLSPERYKGHIVIGETRIPFAARISADFTGRLRFNVEPIPFKGRSTDLVKLMRTTGKPGMTIATFRMEASSASGKRIESDHAYVTSYQHRNSVLKIGLATNQATLRMDPLSPRSLPTLCHHLRGFRSFGPGLHAETPLGIVYTAGATQIASDQEISGSIAVQANGGALSKHWRSDAEDLLMHLRMALSFANGGSLETPVLQYWHNDGVELTFYAAGGSGTPELPVQHFLNLEPFFTSVVTNFEAARSNRDALAMTIGWLLVETTHDEVRFLTGMTALESLASHHLPQQTRQILPDAAFQAIKYEIAAGLENNDQITADERKALKDKLRGFNRASLVRNVKALFDLWGVSRTGIDNKMIHQLVDTRNDIVHRGLTHNNDALWDRIILLREIITRFVLALLRFEGNYVCYVGGQHMRSFPSCERIPGS